MTVIVIIAILALLLMPVYSSMRARAEKIQCMSNLRSLYVGAAAYITDHQQWPQINASLMSNPPTYASAWISALQPYGINQINWLCPTVQRQLGNPNVSLPNKQRVDYIAIPFDDKEGTPYLLKQTPWFIERGAVHADGNLMVFGDGSVKSLQDITALKPQ